MAASLRFFFLPLPHHAIWFQCKSSRKNPILCIDWQKIEKYAKLIRNTNINDIILYTYSNREKKNPTPEINRFRFYREKKHHNTPRCNIKYLKTSIFRMQNQLFFFVFKIVWQLRMQWNQVLFYLNQISCLFVNVMERINDVKAAIIQPISARFYRERKKKKTR